MKIGILYLGKKGAGPVYTLEMARNIYRYNRDICVFLSESVENKADFEEEEFEKRYFKTYGNSLEFLFSLVSVYRIRRIVKAIDDYSPDILYSSMTCLWDPMVFAGIKQTIVKVKTIHDVEMHLGRGITVYEKFVHNMQFKQANKFVILSRKYISQLESKGISQDRICVIPHAGFTSYAKNARISYNEDPVILFFGRIVKYKGLGLLLEAMTEVLRVCPKLTLRIVGSGNLEPYKEQINMLGKNVEVYNFFIEDSQVAQYVSDVDVVVLPYIHATQSGVIPLAYAFHKPVIATDTGALSEQVVDGRTGYIVSADPGAIASKILEMCTRDGREKAKMMGHYANEFMKENLTWDSSARKFLEFMNN